MGAWTGGSSDVLRGCECMGVRAGEQRRTWSRVRSGVGWQLRRTAVWWDVEVFVESGPTGTGSGLNSGDGGGGSGPKHRDGGGGSGKGSPYTKCVSMYPSGRSSLVVSGTVQHFLCPCTSSGLVPAPECQHDEQESSVLRKLHEGRGSTRYHV